MTHHFSIDGSSEKAKALLDFLRTLDYVEVEPNMLTEEHLAILNERRAQYIKEGSQGLSIDEVEVQARKARK